MIQNQRLIEQELLGGLLACENAVISDCGELAESDFYNRKHSLIFRVLKNTERVDMLVLREKLIEAGQWEEVGGELYVGCEIAGRGNSQSVAFLAEKIRELAIKRAILNDCHQIIKMADDESVPVDEIRERFESMGKGLASVSVVASGKGVTEISEHIPALENLYNGKTLVPLTLGMGEFDDYYKVMPGQLTVVTGIPSHGKSEFVDQIAIRMNAVHRWKFAFFSPENYPTENHVQKLVEKYTEKSFFKHDSRMTFDDAAGAVSSMAGNFTFIYPDENELTLDHILSKMLYCIKKYGVKGLVLDPWNEIEANYKKDVTTEAQYISWSLSKIRRFVRKHQVHMWLVAHPRLLIKEDGKYKPPTPYDISGGAQWRNKADNCLTVFRPDRTTDYSPYTAEVYIQKIKFKKQGKHGMIKFYYNFENGNYTAMVKNKKGEYDE